MPAAGLSVVPSTVLAMELPHARRLALALMDEHGLSGWRLELDRARTRAGICRYGRKVIGLSAPLTRLHAEAEVRDTILHEIAHALAGPRAGHGPLWREIAVRLGCSAQRCVSVDAPRVAGAWVGVCPAGHVRERHRRPERVSSCTDCSPRFSVDHLFSWTHRGKPAVMHPNYVEELRALQEGRPLFRLGPGLRARVVAEGDYFGRVGTVVKTGRTRYHLRIREGVLHVPFAGVEPF